MGEVVSFKTRVLHLTLQILNRLYNSKTFRGHANGGQNLGGRMFTYSALPCFLILIKKWQRSLFNSRSEIFSSSLAMEEHQLFHT